MNCKFWEEQKAKVTCATYHEWGYTRETPSDYYIWKSELLNLSGNWDNTSLISEIMDGTSEIWTTILTTELYENAVKFQNAIWFHEKTLMNLSRLTQPAKFDKPTANTYKKKHNFFECMAWTNLVGASTTLPPPCFPRNDANMSKWKFTPWQKGARPCHHCGSDLHWDPKCEHYYTDMKFAHTNHISTDYNEPQLEYNELYYSLDDLDQEPEALSQNTEPSCHLATVKNACTAFYEKPLLNRKTRRTLAQAMDRVMYICREVPGVPLDKPPLELRKLIVRPLGCTFLGSKATESMVGINRIDTDMLKVIIDSGSDITLISDDALSSLSQTPHMHEGQQMNLIQITGSLKSMLMCTW